MNSTQELLTNYSTKQTAVSNKYKNSCYTVVNRLLEDYQDLINPNFKPWYAKAFHVLGENTIIRLAVTAREIGKNKPALFSYLIRNQLKTAGRR